MTTQTERPVEAASKAWNATPVPPHTLEPGWQGGRPDTSKAVSCPECGRRWLNAEWLAQHVEAAHTPKQQRLEPRPRSGQWRGWATRSAIQAITDRIENGTFKPGEVLRQKDLAEEVGVSGGPMAAAVSQLVTEGVLVYDGSSLRRRAVVAAAQNA